MIMAYFPLQTVCTLEQTRCYLVKITLLLKKRREVNYCGSYAHQTS